MNKGQSHGDHIEAIMGVDDFMKNHIVRIIQESKPLGSVVTNVHFEGMVEGETRVYPLIYGEGVVKWVNLLAENSGETLEFITCFPVLESDTKVKAKIVNVDEWNNCIEATITCEIGENLEVSFFATDYAWNKDKYVVGQSVYIDLAALAYVAEEAERGFSFEGQKAVDFLSKIGKQPTYDADGKIEPIHFSTDKLVAFVLKNEDYPEDYEFQSPVSYVSNCEFRGVKMTSCTITIQREPDVYIPVYFKSELLASTTVDMPLRGVAWLQGKMSNNQIDDRKPLVFESESVNKDKSLGVVGYDFVTAINKRIESGELDEFDSFDNLNWMLDILNQIDIKTDYSLDAFEVGDRWGSMFRLYVRKSNADKVYNPTEDKRKRERYYDSMYISGIVDFDEAEKIPEIWSYLKIPFSPICIWNAFLLRCAPTLLPQKWHACYNSRDYIFVAEDIEKLIKRERKSLGEKDLCQLYNYLDNGELYPRVEISGDSATVYFSYWSDWAGLKRGEIKATKDGNTISFDEELTYPIIKYDCGIIF